MPRVTKAARAALLELLAEGWTGEKAMEELPHHRSAWFRIRAREPEFADAWDAAVEQGQEVLGNVVRDELRRRAIDGVDEPVFYQGAVVGHVRKFSDQLLLAMANNLLPEYDHPSTVVHTGKVEHAHNHRLDLAKLTDDELDVYERLLAKAQPERAALTAVTG